MSWRSLRNSSTLSSSSSSSSVSSLTSSSTAHLYNITIATSANTTATTTAAAIALRPSSLSLALFSFSSSSCSYSSYSSLEKTASASSNSSSNSTTNNKAVSSQVLPTSLSPESSSYSSSSSPSPSDNHQRYYSSYNPRTTSSNNHHSTTTTANNNTTPSIINSPYKNYYLQKSTSLMNKYHLLSKSNLSKTLMKLLKQPNTMIHNFTLFFAATIVAAWSSSSGITGNGSPLLLVQGADVIVDANGSTSTTTATLSATEMGGTAGGGKGTSSNEQQNSNSKHHSNEHQGTTIKTTSTTTTMATSAAKSSSTSSTSNNNSNGPNKNCPSYGCPLLPRDMFFDKEAQAALQIIRTLQHLPQQHSASSSSNGSNESKENNNDNEEVNGDKSLSLFYNEAYITNERSEDQATLTLIGYKGGELHEQINQDRAFVISPFYVFANNDNGPSPSKMMRLLGVFDGHAKLGEHVSEYSVQQLPQLLSSKLQTILQTTTQTKTQQEQQQEQIQNAINDTFIEVDKNAPAQISGGCTASIVLQIHTQIYIANAGDSRSFIATFDKNTNKTSIVYITREDKPDIPEEKQRVENAGGQVYIPTPDRLLLGASSRVVYIDKHTGSRNGLAMSRSIGDWAAGELGVIPNPKVDVLDIENLVDDAVHKSTDILKNQDLSTCSSSNEVGDEGEMKKDDIMKCIDRKSTKNDIEVFAVSATDGLLDFVDVNEIAKTVANSLYVDDSPHPLSACESLITTAASSWWKAKNGRYRDDIAIAVSKLSLS